VIANVDRLEQLRRRVIDGWRTWTGDELQRQQLTYSVGDYVWARWGNGRSVQLGRVVLAAPVSFYNGVAEWFYVQIFWPRSSVWREIGTHRRIARALIPSEISQLRDAGVIP
jgi:hypothetical protein